MTDLDPGLEDREPAARRRAGRGWLWAIAPAALVVAGFFLAPTSSTAGVGHWGHRSHGAFGRGPHTPEEAKEHAGRVTEWVLTLVDGTDAQEAEVMAVVTRAIDVLGPVAEQHRANRAAWMEALSAPSVDRERLEALRQQELALAVEASAELVDSLAAVAEVLTPEQRVKLAALAARFPGHSR